MEGVIGSCPMAMILAAGCDRFRAVSTTDPSPASEKTLRRAAAVGGLTSSAAATALAAVAHTIVPALAFPPVSIAQVLVRTTSGEVNSFFIGYLGHWALRLAVFGVALAFAASGLLLGRFLAGKGSTRLWLVVALPLWIAAVVLYPELPQYTTRWVFAAAMLPLHVLAGWIGGEVARKVTYESRPAIAVEEGVTIPRRMPGQPQPTRRYFLIALGVGGAGIALGLANLGARLSDPGDKPLRLSSVRRARRPTPAASDAVFDEIEGLSPEVTSNTDHYVVDEEILDPVIDPVEWTLTIHGLVDTPTRISYDEMIRMDAEERYQTLMCISNEVGGDLISTALWTGVPLKAILDRAGVDSSAAEVVFRAAGGYSDSLPLEHAMDASTLLAIGMNGRVLPRAHGFPARLLSTGTYGYKNPKWLTEIEVVAKPYEGFWQQRGWDKAGKIQTMSRIDVPDPGGVDGPVTIAGIAFAADRGIERVEVSTDGGRSWDRAGIKTALSETSWRLWALEWEPPSSGDYELMVRAIDGDGAVQISRYTDPFPRGATGYHAVTVEA